MGMESHFRRLPHHGTGVCNKHSRVCQTLCGSILRGCETPYLPDLCGGRCCRNRCLPSLPRGPPKRSRKAQTNHRLWRSHRVWPGDIRFAHRQARQLHLL